MAYTKTYAGGFLDSPSSLTTPITAASLNGICDELALYNAAWTSFTPAFTGFTLGNGTSEGVYQLIGRWAVVRFRLILGSTSVITGAMTTVVPAVRTNIRTNFPSGRTPMGRANYYDSSTAAFYVLTMGYNGSNTVGIYPHTVSGTLIGLGVISPTIPVVYGTNDQIYGYYQYETAA